MKKLFRQNLGGQEPQGSQEAQNSQVCSEVCKIAMDASYGLNSKNWSRVANGQTVKPEGIIEPSDVVVVGHLAARVKDQNHDASGVATSTSLVARRVC